MQDIPIKILEEFDSVNFASIPNVLLRFLKQVEDDHASIENLAKLVGQDPGLTARFLTIANSAGMRRSREVMNLEQCMVTLGTRLTRTLAACLAVQTVFAGTAGEKQY